VARQATGSANGRVFGFRAQAVESGVLGLAHISRDLDRGPTSHQIAE
jgi:hypothetical protein